MSYDEQEEYRPEKQGMGLGTKLLIFGGIGCGLVVLLICGGGIFMFQKMKNAVTQDPVEVQKIADSVVKMDAPEELKPTLGFDVKFFGQGMAMAMFAEESGGSMFVMSLSAPYDENNANVDDVRQQMEQQQRQQAPQQGNQQKIIELDEREDIEKDVNGRSGKFLLGRGKDDAGVAHVQVIGVFETKAKEMGMFNLVIPEEHMDMEAGRKLIDSLE